MERKRDFGIRYKRKKKRLVEAYFNEPLYLQTKDYLPSVSLLFMFCTSVRISAQTGSFVTLIVELREITLETLNEADEALIT